MQHPEQVAALPLSVFLPPEQLEALASRVTELLREGRHDGFLDVNGAAAFLSTTPGAIRHKVERGLIPHHRAGGRILFDRSALRAWVERST